MTGEERIKLKILSAYTHSDLTEEQMEFASDFTKDTISFSDPGTGKTHTLIVGLIMAQEYHKIPGDKINCMSFTNAAVSEMAGRYEAACKRCNIAGTVKFNTFHSLSRRMMADAFPSISITAYGNIKEDIADMARYMSDVGIETEDMNFVKKVLRSINSLNSSLTFDPEHVKTKYEFVNLDIPVDVFQRLRKKWFLRGITRQVITQGDIPLYCLYALMSKPHIKEKYIGLYKIMVVDEFQDLSLLHLHILSYVASTLIVIGDMKQQIYAFNGACPQIVDEYLKMHPNARICNLTQSFRCAQPIANFATNIIKPNDMSIQTFTGRDFPAEIKVVERRNLNWKDIADTIAADISAHRLAGARDVMFLYRNNASAIPIIEQLYQLNIPFRCSKFAAVMDVPIFSHLCALADAAQQPDDVMIVSKALKLFPEFKKLPFNQTPAPVEVMKQTGKSLFEIKYSYREKSSYDILLAMQVARKKIEEGKSASVVLNNLLQVYDTYIIQGKWWQFDNTQEFYFSLVAPVIATKTYPMMIADEIEKSNRNQKNIDANMGIRCYTMHSAKGLEADDIYILDCDEGSFPNSKVLKKKLEAGCIYDAACDIRSERNLLYVAITRAKDSVTISYSAQPSTLLTTPEDNMYLEYDDVYKNTRNVYDDAEEFFKLFSLDKRREELAHGSST